MNTLITFIALIAVAVALPVNDLYALNHGQQYFLVPVHRNRRQAETQVGVWGPGVTAGVKHEGTIVNNDSHYLGGKATVTKQFAPDSPITATGRLDYLHKDSGSGLSAAARHAMNGGTDLNLQGKYNVYQNGKFGVDLTGGYERQYGGPRGTSPAQWNTMLQGHYDFN